MASTPPDMEKAQKRHLELAETTSLSDTHREYLLTRYGTIELDPMPDMNDADPLNWPSSRKITNLTLVAFHAFMATFTAAAIQSAFVNIAEDLDVTVQRASYLTSLVIAVLGGAPLFWRPVSDRFGRRPIFLISLIGSLVGNIGCAKSPSYATMGLCRAITAFFISPAAALGSAVVSEMFFKRQRGRYMGVWTALVTLGVPTAPFIFGFLALRVNYRWIYWVLAITNGVQFLLYLFLGPETRYIRDDPHRPTTFAAQFFRFRRIDPKRLTIADFLHPLTLVARPCVMIPAVAYAMVFGFASVLITIEIPQLYPENFGFNTQQVGLQNVSVIIGTIVGEQVGGFMSDAWMAFKKRRGTARPEFRLWLSYIGYVLAIVGIVVFLIQTQNAGTHWNVTPLIGAGIAAGGNQIVTTVLITYAVDCHRDEAAAIGVFITFVRQIWGFIGPFWYPEMIANVGLNGAAGITSGLIIAVSILPTLAMQWKGAAWHR